MTSTNSERTASADALGWAMLAELTGCGDVAWALGGPAPGDGVDGGESVAVDGGEQ
ncbi:hypothetical protein GCM10011579_090920 [Streptomyces albiflavescens]|uniref:Uncharacterized protein n=1 Tax=Streptomyces albiflavescens TaxID=1623582 RepID=A0A917YG44_9ACTN|nr:hypothetical protein [Streptomyces albiflavescens]GGN92746.1 hypothetical protein GCM10011579_090920 [Streptomyces albiflavescens]